ncbi:MAG TPA: diguanylate cyclase [Gammaproteobacteria bacterium]|nr:diguanylate cyclase [Gammaproteobacteria bacterium]
MSLTYCEKFGFDDNKIAERLQWLELSVADHATAQQLQQDIIQPHAEAIVATFYQWLPTLEEAQTLLVDDELVARLKQTQSRYLLSLGIVFDQADYFESRLRVGQAHVWVGLSLSLYQCAYRYLGDLILQHIDYRHHDARKLTTFVYKIIALDMSLAIETYHLTHVRTLEESLDRSQRQQKSLRMDAATDSLTGLANRKTIIDELERALQQPPQAHHPVVAIMADIDHFKTVNDTHGHLVGDKVLIEVSNRIRSALRNFDEVGRYGGEEFLLVLNGANLTTSKNVAERIREHVSSQPVNLQGLEIQASISLGVAAARPGETADSVLARADRALYAAKAAGRNCVIIADA